MTSRDLPIMEPFVVQDTFVTGSLPVQMMGDNMRLTLIARERSHYDGTLQAAVVSKLVGSRADLLRIADAIIKGCTGEDAFNTFSEFGAAPSGRH